MAHCELEFIDESRWAGVAIELPAGRLVIGGLERKNPTVEVLSPTPLGVVPSGIAEFSKQSRQRRSFDTATFTFSMLTLSYERTGLPHDKIRLYLLSSCSLSCLPPSAKPDRSPDQGRPPQTCGLILTRRNRTRQSTMALMWMPKRARLCKRPSRPRQPTM